MLTATDKKFMIKTADAFGIVILLSNLSPTLTTPYPEEAHRSDCRSNHYAKEMSRLT